MHLNNKKLLDVLHQDEELCDKNLYSAGPYWKDKAKKISCELKRKGLDNFRGYNSGVGTSYCDNIVTNFWDEEVSRLNNILKFMFYKLPIFKRVGGLFQTTQNALVEMHKQKLHFQEVLLNKHDSLKKLLDTFEVEDTTHFGCVDAVNIRSQLYSAHYLELLNTLSFISEKIDFTQVKSMFEIGGGFGANVHLMLQNFKNLKKVIYLDIVPNLFVGTEYLRSLYGTSVIDYLATKDRKKIQFSNNDSLEIYCLAAWQIEKLDAEIDYFHNSHSFVEMPQEVVGNYSYYIQKIMKDKGKIALVSYDNFSEKTTFDPSELKDFFKKKFNVYEHLCLVNADRKNYYLIS
jgi:putative sugar O-methyltransferase